MYARYLVLRAKLCSVLIIVLTVGLVTLNFHLFLALNGGSTSTVMTNLLQPMAAGGVGIATYLVFRDAYKRIARRLGIGEK